MSEVTKLAYGKINLGLDVLGKREDGYHLVRMIMQTVEVHDTVVVETNTTGEITMTCDNDTLPVDENNLCIRASPGQVLHRQPAPLV